MYEKCVGQAKPCCLLASSHVKGSQQKLQKRNEPRTSNRA